MLYQVVTGEIREGDVSRWIDKTLVPVNAHWIGKDASEVDFIVLRPVKVPSEEEMLQAVVNHCQKEIDCENCHSERECYQCYYKTMLRLMGIESEQQATETEEVEGYLL